MNLFFWINLFLIFSNQILAKNSHYIDNNDLNKNNYEGFREIKIGYVSNDEFGVQDTSGINEWSYVSESATKRCDFRQINVLCFEEIGSSSPVCQHNCQYRGYWLGLCYSEPGPANEPSGEWQQSRGSTFCYCQSCQNDKCMAYCHRFGFATGYCHESANYGNGCKCVGCEVSLCSKHCANAYGSALQQSVCRENECKCLANSCLNYGSDK